MAGLFQLYFLFDKSNTIDGNLKRFGSIQYTGIQRLGFLAVDAVLRGGWQYLYTESVCLCDPLGSEGETEGQE